MTKKYTSSLTNAQWQVIENKLPDLPPGVSLTPWNDEALLLQGRIDLLTENAKYGLFFVLIVLALFLKPKLAFWISLGIPISFMGGFWFMPIMDLSINMLSLFTFILVLGIVVDDAIVVGENISLFIERGLDPEEAAVQGAAQVTTPVIFAVLTTMATFSPMLAVGGTIGPIWRIFPLITIIVLFWSLIESLTILPAHLAHSVDKKPKNKKLRSLSDRWDKFQDQVKYFLSKFDVAPEITEKYLSSFSINQRINRDAKHAKQLLLTSTPMIVVDGTYIIENRGSFADMLKVADYVIELQRPNS